MVKLANGSSPETSDWEYVMGEGFGAKPWKQDLRCCSFCHSCHTAAAATDYRFINSDFLKKTNL